MKLAHMTLTQAEIGELLHEVGRFANRTVAPLVAQPEIALTLAHLDRLAHQAEELGLLNPGPEAGMGLWEDWGNGVTPSFTLAALTRLAETDSAAAWHFHQLAFGRQLSLQLDQPQRLAKGRTIASLQGHYGLARAALPRYLAGVELTADETAFLHDYFQPLPEEGELILHAADNWQWLLAPAFDDGEMAWRLLSPDDVICRPHPHSHGLDGIPCYGWQASNNVTPSIRLHPDDAKRLYGETMQLTSLAIMAVALGAVKRSYRLARAYAAIRRQGGKLIEDHPAVQMLLANIQGTIRVGTELLASLAQEPLALSRCGHVLSACSKLMPSLSHAASDAMQIMGGIGYMRDTGVEKVLRDVNQLRLMHGTPADLKLFAAEWEKHR